VRGVTRAHAVVADGVLRTRLAEPWTLSSLAEEVHLSRSHLGRTFTLWDRKCSCVELLRTRIVALVGASTRGVVVYCARVGVECLLEVTARLSLVRRGRFRRR
jgi:hypothetical protein